MSVILQTSIGSIVIDLYTKQAPKETTNFLNLCKAKYYTFAPLYNIQKDYVVEFGDPLYPLSKEGRSAWHLADNSKPKHFLASKNTLRNNTKGSVAFLTQKDARGLDQYATSIVTITLADLDQRRGAPQGVVFGQVVEGLDILEKINTTIVDETHRPYQDIRIHHTYIIDDTFDTIEGLEIPSTPEPSEEQLSTVRLDDLLSINVDEPQELTEDQLSEKRKREAESKALTLELMGDLPSAEVKPMENVLFVCKLNPITKDDDLEIIFSRFGKIISCEVIKDKDSGDSMQYAFIEYEEKRSCEAAYLKMDGVLLDNRRIHVDFSQSVSKLADAWRDKTNDKRTREHGGLKRGSYQRDSRPRDDYKSTRDDNERRDHRREKDYKDRRDADYRDRREHRDKDHHRSRDEGSHRDSRDSGSSRSSRDHRDRDGDRRDRDRDRDSRHQGHREKEHHRSSDSSSRDYR